MMQQMSVVFFPQGRGKTAIYSLPGKNKTFFFIIGRYILFLARGEHSCLFISQTHWRTKRYVKKTLLEAHFSVLFHSVTPCSLTGSFVHLAREPLLAWSHGGLSKVYMLWRWVRRAIRINRPFSHSTSDWKLHNYPFTVLSHPLRKTCIWL